MIVQANLHAKVHINVVTCHTHIEFISYWDTTPVLCRLDYTRDSRVGEVAAQARLSNSIAFSSHYAVSNAFIRWLIYLTVHYEAHWAFSVCRVFFSHLPSHRHMGKQFPKGIVYARGGLRLVRRLHCDLQELLCWKQNYTLGSSCSPWSASSLRDQWQRKMPCVK
jgi:hypothetical protein